MTKQQLIDNATAKNFKIEFGENKFGNELIGINKNNWVWHWFEVYPWGNVFFKQSYSQITGKSKKGTMHGLRVEMSLEK